MKKRWLLIVMTLLLALPLAFLGSQSVGAASETTNVVLHKRIFRDVNINIDPDYDYVNDGSLASESSKVMDEMRGLNGARFKVYDATDDFSKSGLSQKDYQQRWANMPYTEAEKAAQNLNLPAVGNELVTKTDTIGDGSSKTDDGIAKFTVANKKDGQNAVYLVIEQGLTEEQSLNVDLKKGAVPLVMFMPFNRGMDTVHLYPKNVGYVRDPFFFKYGKQNNGNEVRLEGAVFAFYRYDSEGTKRYLLLSNTTDLKNEWNVSADPLNDDQVEKFTSDKNGLVDTGPRFFPSGTYYFEELKTADGYLNDIGKDGIVVEIPKTWNDPVKINGQVMDEKLDGSVPTDVIDKGFPRVYNSQKSIDPTDPSTPTDPQTPTTPGGGGGSTGSGNYNPGKGWLPNMSDASGWMLAVLGLFVMVGAWYLLRRRETHTHTH